jgi:iron(III) transport system ATP-binding protein
MATVRVQDAVKRFGAVAAVDGVSLEIPHAELLAVLGPSGCGKTTLLRLVAGFLEPDGGEIWVGERRLSAVGDVTSPDKRRMSMVFQSYAVWPHKTVFENIAYGLKFRDLPRPERRRRVEEILAVVRLEALADRYPGELSGGQQQRVALARAIVVEPETLLLDEPLSNLDANLREEMRFEIRRLHERFKITALYVTHDQAEAMVIADRIAVMNRGRVEQIGPPEEIYQRPRTEFVATFIGRTNVLPARVVAAGLAEAAGLRLRVGDAGGERFPPASEAAIVIRPHDVELLPGGAAPPGEDAYPGRITRAAYLGESWDLTVALADGALALRAMARPAPRFAVGDPVVVRIPPAACHLVPR